MIWPGSASALLVVLLSVLVTEPVFGSDGCVKLPRGMLSFGPMMELLGASGMPLDPGTPMVLPRPTLPPMPPMPPPMPPIPPSGTAPPSPPNCAKASAGAMASRMSGSASQRSVIARGFGDATAAPTHVIRLLAECIARLPDAAI